MARRDMPYLPLYVQDFMTDEKLIECSAESTGVYIRLLCIMHKSQDYGAILLKQKDKQNESTLSDFACKISKQMPWDTETVLRGLTELISEGVISIDGDVLFQKRMVKDGKLSDTRASAGKKGGKKSRQNVTDNPPPPPIASGFASGFATAKTQANTENEIESSSNNITIGREEAEPKGTYKEDRGSGGKEESPYDSELALVMSFYQDKINSTPGRISVDGLRNYTEQLGAEVVIHALEIALDNQKYTWSYIEGILSRYSKDGLTSLDAVLRSEQEFKSRRSGKGGSANGEPTGHSGTAEKKWVLKSALDD